MTLYSHKNFLVSVNRAEEDGKLLVMSGEEIPVMKGEYILTDQDGNCYPLTETRFKDYYVPVQRVEKNSEDFANAYARQIAEFNTLEMNQEEDNDYITKTLELSKNKPF